MRRSAVGDLTCTVPLASPGPRTVPSQNSRRTRASPVSLVTSGRMDSAAPARGAIGKCLHIMVTVFPEGRQLELPKRGKTWVRDLPGPTPDAPTVVLLH